MRINIINEKMERGYVSKGKTYPGKVHFILEDGKASRFNTLRALKILRFYDPISYEAIVNRDFDYDMKEIL